MRFEVGSIARKQALFANIQRTSLSCQWSMSKQILNLVILQHFNHGLLA
jgi:hypothetical protein